MSHLRPTTHIYFYSFIQFQSNLFSLLSFLNLNILTHSTIKSLPNFMQASVEEMSNPNHQDSYLETELSHDFFHHLNLESDYNEEHEDEDEDEIEEEEFSFMCGEANTSPIAAEDAFINGKIKPLFPLFNMEDLPIQPPVKNVFVTSSTPKNDVINDGEWSAGKAVQVGSPEICKKSNSTGFSKIWRFKELLGRSNSDGRDTFVFLNNEHAQPHVPPHAAETVKKQGKKKTAALSAHEVYLRSKAKSEEKRRSYLPYRPELMGFFTNVNGGLTKNVHPF